MDQMQRAFLNAQAGILAKDLQDGVPCPVCGSLEHPHPAELPAHAPTEDAVKQAKTFYDDAQSAASDASNAAAAQVATMDTKKDALRKKLEKLLPDTAEEQAEAAAQEQLHDCETQIDELNAKIEAAKKNIRIKSELDEKIPKKADARKAAEDDWYNADQAARRSASGAQDPYRSNCRVETIPRTPGQIFRRKEDQRAARAVRGVGKSAFRRTGAANQDAGGARCDPRRDRAAAKAA